MTQQIVPFDSDQGGAVTLRLPLPGGGELHAVLPTPADQDRRFLATWLYGKAAKTQRDYAADIARLYAYTGKSLQQITLEDVQDFLASLARPGASTKHAGQPLAPATRARITAAVKSCLSFGKKTGYLPVNVGSAVKLPRIEDRLAERILSEAQVARMFALEQNPRNHAILVLLYRAGLRVSELCNLQWRHLQERSESGQITVFGKGSKTRHVLLDEATWSEVMALKIELDHPDDYVFRSRQTRSSTPVRDRDREAYKGWRLDESQVHRIVARAARRSGIKGKVSPHWMRHAHATHALERGAPISLVKETLGHKSMETTAKYTHVRPGASSAQYLGV